MSNDEKEIIIEILKKYKISDYLNKMDIYNLFIKLNNELCEFNNVYFFEIKYNKKYKKFVYSLKSFDEYINKYPEIIKNFLKENIKYYYYIAENDNIISIDRKYNIKLYILIDGLTVIYFSEENIYVNKLVMKKNFESKYLDTLIINRDKINLNEINFWNDDHLFPWSNGEFYPTDISKKVLQLNIDFNNISKILFLTENNSCPNYYSKDFEKLLIHCKKLQSVEIINSKISIKLLLYLFNNGFI